MDKNDSRCRRRDWKAFSQNSIYNISYYKRQNIRYIAVFWINFDRKMIEICGFQHLIAKTHEHIFISKSFPKTNSENRFSKGSLENHDFFPKTAIRAYWYFYIFGISIENCVDSCMFRIFSRTFFFVEKFTPTYPQGQVKKWIQSKSHLDSGKQVRSL